MATVAEDIEARLRSSLQATEVVRRLKCCSRFMPCDTSLPHDARVGGDGRLCQQMRVRL